MNAPMHRFEEHTGEVQIHLQAPDRAGLFRQAATALAELMAPDAVAGRPVQGAPRSIELKARDAAALLVDWLDELIYLTDTTGQVFPEIEVEEATETSIRARAYGFVPDAFKTAVKAATFHGLAVKRSDGLFSARVVLDV